MPEVQLLSVGEVLCAARTEAGLSIEDLSRATKIRGQLIREIEADTFSGCGGAVYARGHIRSIATLLELDPAPLLAEFARAHGEAAGPAPREIFEHEVIDLPHRTHPNWTAAMAVAAAALLLVALVSLFNTDNTRAPESFALESTPSPSASAAPQPQPQESAKGDPLAGLVNEDGVFVRVRVVNSRSWVAAVVDGKPAFGQTLAAGAQMDFKGTQLVHLTIGNAGAVQLIVNGRDLGIPGRAGAVLRLDFGPGDPAGATTG